MTSSRSLYRSFGLLLALLLFLVGLSLSSFRATRRANELNIASYQTLMKTQTILRDLLNMETGARGFLITANEDDLEPYERGQTNFTRHLSEIKELVGDEPTQQERLETLEKLQKKWALEYLDPLINQRRSAMTDSQTVEAADSLSTERTQIFDEMRETVAQIEDFQKDVLETRSFQSAQRQRRTETILWGGGLFSIVLAGVLAALAARAFAQLDHANSQLKFSYAQMEASNLDLAKSNAELQEEIKKRELAENKLRETLDDLSRSNADLEQFAYVASHDLQEPLRAVAGCVQVLQRRYSGKLDERADQFIEHAVDGAQRMQNLIHDLLAYSRIGTRTKPFAAFEMEEVANAVLKSLRVPIQEAGAQITRDALPSIIADRTQIEQTLQNLVSNALKFRGPEKVPQIHLGYELVGEEHVFRVQDNGLGIEPQYFERIFVMFQRLHTRTEYAGTGIGLAICKKIIERHGGRLWVESEFGQGTTFFFALPVEPEIVVEEES